MNDTSINVRLVEVKRTPGYVQQHDDTVRVFRNQPDRVQLQIRNPRWYGTASLTADQARAVIAALQAGLAEISGKDERYVCRDCGYIGHDALNCSQCGKHDLIKR